MTANAVTTFDSLDQFNWTTTEKIRYSDMDPQGHVNNCVFSVYFESARVESLFNARAPILSSGGVFVVARMLINFKGEVLWPGDVVIGTRIKDVGRSSITLEQSLFQNGVCCATAETVIVHIDMSTRRSTPLNDNGRQQLLDTIRR